MKSTESTQVSISCSPKREETPQYRSGDQRPDGMYFYARRHNRLTGVWLTGPAFRKANKGKFPERKGRLRYDGKRFYRGAWVSQEVFDKLIEDEKIKRICPGTRKRGDNGAVLVFSRYKQGIEEVWVPEAAWVARQEANKKAKAARKRHNEAIRKPKVCGQFVKEGLMFVGEFESTAGGRPTRVYFNCAQWKAALEGQNPPPPGLKRARLRAYWWLVRRLQKNK